MERVCWHNKDITFYSNILFFFFTTQLAQKKILKKKSDDKEKLLFCACKTAPKNGIVKHYGAPFPDNIIWCERLKKVKILLDTKKNWEKSVSFRLSIKFHFFLRVSASTALSIFFLEHGHVRLKKMSPTCHFIYAWKKSKRK